MLARDYLLDLDLSFNRASDDILSSIKDAEIQELLTNSTAWEKILIEWIQFIRSDLNILCPSVVRSANSISMGLRFTNDVTISELNNLWRNEKKATDVLSFPMIDSNFSFPSISCVELGDIVVSVSTAKRQAKDMNHSLGIELRWLVSHGLLHLLGWDHLDSISLEQMLSFQKQLIGKKNNLVRSTSSQNHNNSLS